MARFIVAMNVSLDGYVNHEAFAPGPELFRHWIEQVGRSTAAIYGRRIYEIMRYWEEDQPGWSPDEHAFAKVWRAQPKWVVSRTLSLAGPDVSLIPDGVEAKIRNLKTSLVGDVDVSGTELAHSLATWGLIDEFRLYMHPVVLGGGKPFFAGRVPPLRLSGNDLICEGVVRLSYVPA